MPSLGIRLLDAFSNQALLEDTVSTILMEISR